MSTAPCAVCGSAFPLDLDVCPACGLSRQPPTQALPPGTALQNGRFAVGRVLGEGGFGITYKGAHKPLRRVVAIKELFPDGAQRQGRRVLISQQRQAEYRKALTDALAEARRIVGLDAPGIVEVFDAFAENGTVYIVMEYLEGQTLQERIEEQGPLPSATVRALALEICDALAVLHAQQLLHRDLKPNNLMLTGDGRTVLIDFGSARHYQADHTSRHTRILTEDYAALEQYSQAARFGPYTDIFALGGTLFHALTGAPPPRAITRLQTRDGALPWPAGMDAALTRAIDQALRLRVADRPQTVGAFRQLLAGGAPTSSAVRGDSRLGPVLGTSGSSDNTVHLWRFHASPTSCAFCSADIPRDLDTCPACGTPRELAARALPSGTSLKGGLLAIDQVLGEGGFGITYKGVHQKLQRDVAIKELFPANAQRQGSNILVSQQTEHRKAVEDTHREARHIARFDSPGIVKVFDTFQENNTVYIVMEYLEGQTLMDRIREQGSLPPETVHRLALTICEALEAIHEQRLLHRDIKPDNLMLTRDGRTVLIDFGSARPYQSDRTSRHTRILTQDYAAPEQYSRAARFGPPVDVFALGATLFHALTGAPPPRAIERLQNSDLAFQLPAGMGFVLARAIDQALRLEVEDRPPTAQAFRQLLAGDTPTASAIHGDNRPRPVLVASGSWDNTVRLWDVVSGQCRRTLQAHTGAVSAVAFSPDGLILASGSWDNTVRLWDVVSGQCRRTLQAHTGAVSAVAFSPDGLILASGSWDNTVRLWDVVSGQCRRTLQAHTGAVSAVAFSPDGLILASGSGDRTMRLWDVASGQCRRTLQAHTGAVSAVAFSPDGRTLASGSVDDTVRLWDVVSGQCRRTLRGHTEAAFTVAFSTLASGSVDDTVRLWDVVSGQYRRTLRGHMGVVCTVAFSPDGRTLASGSVDNTVRLWDAASGQCRHILHHKGVCAVAFSPQ